MEGGLFDPWPPSEQHCGLPRRDVARYSRQLLVPSFGAPNTAALRQLAVLVVGAGGLGCPAALYLAGAGVRLLGIVDDDVVEASNLHRQVGHTEAAVGVPKAVSLAQAVRALNSGVQVTPHVECFTPSTAASLVAPYDVVVDCTDNPATRYLVNDACVLRGVPLVSGAAVGTDGQASVHGWRGGPCYRCLHPRPPAGVQSCADAGVLGPVTGVVGCLLALEVMKLAGRLAEGGGSGERGAAGGGAAGGDAAGGDVAGGGAGGGEPPSHDDGGPRLGFGEPLSQRLLVLDGADARVRVVRLRPRSPQCAVCGEAPTIRSMADSGAWCAAQGLAAVEATLPPPQHAGAGRPLPCDCPPGGAQAREEPVPETSVRELAVIRRTTSALHAALATAPPEAGAVVPACPRILILDVRPPVQFGICALRGSVSLPLARLLHDCDGALQAAGVQPGGGSGGAGGWPLVYVICRRGVDSVAATRLLRARGVPAFNVTGGLQAWAREVDGRFPMY